MPTVYEELKSTINGANVLNPEIVEKLQLLSFQDRERLAFETKTRVVYLGEEVPRFQKVEEDAVLMARPKGYETAQLNGLNVGCGGRRISPHLLPIDIARAAKAPEEGGHHAEALPDAFLADPMALPFKEGSVDYIVALHMVEHMPDPAATILYWLSLVKSGGGIGLVLPDWRYTWNTEFDWHPYGHKWNCEPDVVRRIWEKHLSEHCELEALDTYEMKMSFDVILRKPGQFRPFDIANLPHYENGGTLARQGRAAHQLVRD